MVCDSYFHYRQQDLVAENILMCFLRPHIKVVAFFFLRKKKKLRVAEKRIKNSTPIFRYFQYRKGFRISPFSVSMSLDLVRHQYHKVTLHVQERKKDVFRQTKSDLRINGYIVTKFQSCNLVYWLILLIIENNVTAKIRNWGITK